MKKVFNLKELHYFEIIFWLLFFFYPTDRSNLSRWRAVGNETFYWDGLMIRLRKVEKTIQTLCNWIIFLLFNNTEKYVDKTVSVS